MKNSLALLVATSRPRFWLYLGGTYLLGYTLGAASLNLFVDPRFFLHLFYFLFVANLLLYGVNDLFDADTDQFNEKKLTHEHLLMISERSVLILALCLSGALSLGLVLFQGNWSAAGILVAFLFLAVFYSAPPLRFKARPVIDSASNVLYALPGIMGYYQTSGEFPTAPALVAAAAWSSSMHLFSAIPDIDADQKAGLITTAVVLGERYSLIACTLLWLVFASIVLYSGLLWPLSLLALVYPAIPLFLLFKPVLIGRIYWRFAGLNGLVGFLAVISTMAALT